MDILFTTLHRGIFVAQVPDDYDLTATTFTNLKKCRMVVRHRTGKGVQGVAAEGPSQQCLLSATTDAPVIHNVTAVFLVSPEASAKIWPNG